MTNVRISERIVTVPLRDCEARIRPVSMLHGSSVRDAVEDDMGVFFSFGPMTIYLSAMQAQDLSEALAATARHLHQAAASTFGESEVESMLPTSPSVHGKQMIMLSPENVAELAAIVRDEPIVLVADYNPTNEPIEVGVHARADSAVVTTLGGDA